MAEALAVETPRTECVGLPERLEEAKVNSRGLIWDLVTKTLVLKLKKNEPVNPDSEDDAPDCRLLRSTSWAVWLERLPV